MRKRRERIETEDQGALGLSMGEALAMRGPDPDDGTAPRGAQELRPRAAAPASPRKAVLQRARAGGGKWVVRVLLTPQPEQTALDDLAREARRALGTGARVEGGAILVQGDIPERVEAWLRGRGVEKVIR